VKYLYTILLFDIALLCWAHGEELPVTVGVDFVIDEDLFAAANEMSLSMAAEGIVTYTPNPAVEDIIELPPAPEGPPSPILVGIDVSGQAGVVAGSQAHFTCDAHYSDDTCGTLPSTWSVGGAGVSIDTNGILSTESSTTNQHVLVEATYGGYLSELSVLIYYASPTGQVGLPTERFALPTLQGEHLVCMWDLTAEDWLQAHENYDHSGGYIFPVPVWDQWYWIGLWDLTAEEYVFGKWIGHFITY